MLIHGASLINRPVLSLHVGGEIARIIDPIIDPNTLKIVAFRVYGPLIKDDVGDILPVDSIRETSPLGIVIDSGDDLVKSEEVVRIQDIVKLNFDLIGLKVVTKKGAKVGKVSDFIVDSDFWEIAQLVVQRPVFKSLIDPELLIHRTSIIEINDYQVIIRDEHDRAVSAPKSEAIIPKDFINPFRKPDFASRD